MVQLSLLAVQGLEHVAVLGAFHNDLMTGQQVIVEGVHGLSVLFHNVVCDVHDVVDGADAGGCQAVLEPLGRRSQMDVLHHSGAVAFAEVCIFYRYL